MKQASWSSMCLVVLVSACGSDSAVPIDGCEYGLYWAECGGNGEPVLGCDRETGSCRWFAGGIVAQNHAVSNCPVSDVCCHDNWPFEDFRPSGPLLDSARDSMSMVRGGVLDRQGVSDVTTVADLEGGSRTLTIRCLGGGEPSMFPCDETGSGGHLVRVGNSVVAVFERGSYRFELEIVQTAELDDWDVNLFRSAVWMRDPTPVVSCNNYRVGTQWAVSGVLHVNTTDTSNLDLFHGRFDGEVDGNQFVMEF
jgi:hypothetical protein